MSAIVAARMTAELDREIVVFLIGMRINRLWKVHTWLPVALAMPRMIRELSADSSSGFIHAHAWFGNPTIMLQYWRSFDDLERYAKSSDASHLPAWSAFNRRARKGSDVGIWHETYRIGPGQYECVYNNMPLFGLAKAARSVPAVGHLDSASARMYGAPPPSTPPSAAA
jgi:hypothetical protein